MSEKSTTAAFVVIAVLASASGAFAGPPDPLDELFGKGSRYDQLSLYPGPVLTTPDPLYPNRPERKTREEKAGEIILEGMGEKVLQGFPATWPYVTGYKVYKWVNADGEEKLCFENSFCQALLPEERTSNRADIERPDTDRARKDKSRFDEFLEDDSPYSVPPFTSAHLRLRNQESAGYRRQYQQELEQRLQRKIERDRRAANTYRDAARANDEFLDDVNRRLNDPATDPSQRPDLSNGAELLKRYQQYYKDQGIVPSPSRDGYVAPTPMPVFTPRQPPVLPDYDVTREGKSCKGICRPD